MTEEDRIIPHDYELIGKIMLNLIANKIVSVQPKLNPSTTIYYTQLEFKNGKIVSSTVSEQKNVVTRKLKTVLSDDVHAMAKSIVTEINNELLTDIFNNCGTIGKREKADKDSIYSAIISASGVIYRKTYREGKYWIVVSPAVYQKYNEAFDLFKNGNYTVHCVEGSWKGNENTILIGRQGKHLFDHSYIWSPYIMIAKTPVVLDENFAPQREIIMRYGKFLSRQGPKAFAKIVLEE